MLDPDTQLLHFSDLDKACVFNKHFHKVFTIDDGNLPLTIPKTYEPMPDFVITPDDILSATRKMKDKLTRTPESIPSYFIKRIISVILHPLVTLFNFCIQNKFVPTQWKTSLIVPVYKKGDRSNATNYRPISLTSSFSRLFESILHDKISSHLLHNPLLSSSKFGFLSQTSSCDQLLMCIHEWLVSISNGSSVDVIYTDIQKAFDSVSHSKLISIIRSYGICNSVCNWLEEFLTNRSQSVCIGAEVSSSLAVDSGVPQGSVIGPLTFLIYFNNSTECVNSSFACRGIKLFADDAKIYDVNQQSLESSLNRFLLWLKNHQLDIAPSKCFSLSVTRQKDHIPPSLLINNVPLSNQPHIKDLGIMISGNLKWKTHINYIFRKASTCLYQLLKCFKTKNIWTLIKLFICYVRPKLEYNSPVWSPYLEQDKNHIESIQKRFTRAACLRCGIMFTSYQDRLLKLNMISLETRRLHMDLFLMYKILHGLCSINFDQYFKLNNSTYNLRRNSLQIIQIHKSTSKHSQWHQNFFNRIVPLWNQLPDSIVSAQSLNIFKIRLKNHSFT